MIYSHIGQAFSFHQIHTNELNIPSSSFKKTQSKSQNAMRQQSNNSGDNINSKIDASAEFLKQRTINLVQTLRKYSLPKSLELQIEGYLTNVLDQMDVLQNLNKQKLDISSKKTNNLELQSFMQLQKPQGDQEDSYLEQTLRQLPTKLNIEDTKQRNETLHKKIQNILQSFQDVQLFDKPQINIEQKSLFQIEQKSERNQTSNQSRINRGAHRFSNMCIRDFQKQKKNKIL